MRYTWKKSWSVLLMLLILLITIGCASEQKPDSGEMPTGFHEEYNENDIPNDPDEPDDWNSEDDLDAIKEVQEELRENFEGKYYTCDTMTPERQAYRLSCIREGINLSTNGGVGAFDQRYNDAMRNVYSLNGQDAVMSGTVIYADRQGMYTSLLIQKPYQNIIVAAYAEGGKKRDKALALLSAWLPDMEKFSREIQKQSDYINSLKQRVSQSEQYADHLREGRYAEELKVQEANRRIFELQRTNQQLERLVKLIPPEVLAELQKGGRDRPRGR